MPNCFVAMTVVFVDALCEPMALSPFEGPYEGGEFVTPPLSIEGSNLLINYATTGGGSIRLELWVFSVEERVSLSTNGSQPTYCRNPHPSEREYQSAFFRSTISESLH